MTGCNLIVNYLPSDLTESELSSMFNSFGKVESAKIVKNKATGASLCYGFVIMEGEQQAQESIKGLNHKEIRGKTLRVGIAKPRGTSSNDTNSNLYITGINPDLEETKLNKFFSRFGEILSSKVLKNANDKGTAFVRFSKIEDAQRAIEETNGKPFCSNDCDESCTCTDIMTVKYALPSKNTNKGSNLMNSHLMSPFHTHMVPGIPPQMVPSQIPAYNYGPSSTLPNYGYASGHMQNLVTANSTPAAYTTLQYQQAVNGYYGYYPSTMYAAPAPAVNPRQTFPGYAIPQPPQAPVSPATLTPGNLIQLSSNSHCVFVYGLPQAATEEELQALFYPFGTISNCRVCYETTEGKRVCKGYGFVNFYSYNDAQQAINALNNYNYKGHTLQVRFKSSKDGR